MLVYVCLHVSGVHIMCDTYKILHLEGLFRKVTFDLQYRVKLTNHL